MAWFWKRSSGVPRCRIVLRTRQSLLSARSLSFSGNYARDRPVQRRTTWVISQTCSCAESSDKNATLALARTWDSAPTSSIRAPADINLELIWLRRLKRAIGTARTPGRSVAAGPSDSHSIPPVIATRCCDAGQKNRCEPDHGFLASKLYWRDS